MNSHIVLGTIIAATTISFGVYFLVDSSNALGVVNEEAQSSEIPFASTSVPMLEIPEAIVPAADFDDEDDDDEIDDESDDDTSSKTSVAPVTTATQSTPSDTKTPSTQTTVPKTTTTETSPTSLYTMATVATHSTKSSCWSVINDNVYDLTKYIPVHPGGQSRIINICGRDGSALFNDQHGRSSKIAKILATMYLAPLSK